MPCCGHGLPMMRTFMDDVALRPSAGGTTVRMSWIIRSVLPDLTN